ncbi:hypothetical protein H8D04_00385 [bacterium]|nr:hypothetical protein [bacterium]
MNDKLLELKRKKLQHKILYLRTELEETTLIFNDSLVEFEKEFGEYFRKKETSKDAKRVTTDPIEYDIPEEDVNVVFKQIAKKTHPDKLGNKNISQVEYEELVDLYKEALGSVENKDWSKVMEIAMELGIDISNIKKDDSEYLEESVSKLTEKINELKGTYAWQWKDTPDENKEIVKERMLKSLGLNINEEKNDE